MFDLDHLLGADEMVFHPLPAVDAGGLGLGDHRFKVPVIHIAKDLGEVPAGPEFVARRIHAADGLKRRDFVAHGAFNCVQMNQSNKVIFLG